MNKIFSDTGLFWWTFEDGMKALEHEKEKGYFSLVNSINGFKAYETLIKGIPENPNNPKACWAVTNRFDPRITHIKETE